MKLFIADEDLYCGLGYIADEFSILRMKLYVADDVSVLRMELYIADGAYFAMPENESNPWQNE